MGQNVITFNFEKKSRFMKFSTLFSVVKVDPKDDKWSKIIKKALNPLLF